MKTATTQQINQEHSPSVKRYTTGKELAQDLKIDGLLELIDGERQTAQVNIESIKAVLDVLDIINLSNPSAVDEIDLGAMIHILSGLAGNIEDSLTMIDDRTSEIRELC